MLNLSELLRNILYSILVLYSMPLTCIFLHQTNLVKLYDCKLYLTLVISAVFLKCFAQKQPFSGLLCYHFLSFSNM